MEVMERINSKLDDTRDKVIEQGTRQQEDRRLHDERHAENQRWRKQHLKQHVVIMNELEVVRDSIMSNATQTPAPPTVNKNLLMKLAFGAFFLLIGLIYALTGNSMPKMPGITE